MTDATDISTSTNTPTNTSTQRAAELTGIAHFRPWHDRVVDAHGFDPRSRYVERYWLSVIGPTATWVLRRLADEFDDQPEGFTLDLAHTASTMGLSFKRGLASPFGKALHRCVMFGLAQQLADGFAVRRKVPTVAHRHLRRLPPDVRAAHQQWVTRHQGPAAPHTST